MARKMMDPSSELISIAPSPYTLLKCLWISIGLQPFALRNSVATSWLVRASTVSGICTDNVLKARDWLEHQLSWWSWTVSLSGGKGKKFYPTLHMKIKMGHYFRVDLFMYLFWRIFWEISFPDILWQKWGCIKLKFAECILYVYIYIL